jgi:DNA-binding XRE family transcriptional regulator
MSEQNKSEKPFESLGDQLKRMRNKRKESLIEVSGAVEIEADQLSSYEQGAIRPSEDILLLLISYFGVKEDQATKLWELAGYSSDGLPYSNGMNDDQGNAVSQVMVMPMDARIVYTDLVHVMVNNYGVVVNFMQGSGPNNQPLAVSRIGMSKEHAHSLIEVLQKTLEQAEKPKETKQLPESTKKNEEPEEQKS